jgi:hypothetical protein
MTAEPCAWVRDGDGNLADACHSRGVMPERAIRTFRAGSRLGPDGARGPGQRGAAPASLRRVPPGRDAPFQPGGKLARGPHPVLQDRREDLKASDFAGVLRTAGVKLRVGRRWGHRRSFSTRLAVDANG